MPAIQLAQNLGFRRGEETNAAPHGVGSRSTQAPTDVPDAVDGDIGREDQRLASGERDHIGRAALADFAKQPSVLVFRFSIGVARELFESCPVPDRYVTTFGIDEAVALKH
ncbi:hypothetical protein KXS03_23725, partial [Neorhizobium petrolearium]